MNNILIWIISLIAIAGVIIRPFKIAEAFWAVGGTLLLVFCKLLQPAEAATGISKGIDVYLFLTGMMLLAETARSELFFDWLAAHATRLANGSAKKLFLLIYLVGVVVTTFLSNDATAVVLTPAVAAAVKAAKVKNAFPYLLICAFIANAASFVLPISNPANLVLYNSRLPTLGSWLSLYFIPSVVSIVVTFIMLRFIQRHVIKQTIATNIIIPPLSKGGKTTIAGIILTAFILIIASSVNIRLGLPTAITGIMIALIVFFQTKKNPWPVIRNVSWSVLPLVAGLFVIVEAMNKTGMINTLTNTLQQSAVHSVSATVWSSGLIVAFGCNLLNNLPAGLIAGNVLQTGHIPEIVRRAILIGVDLGPNLSITGSLATILWLIALRREGQNISAWAFLKLGFVIMTAALFFTIASLFW